MKHLLSKGVRNLLALIVVLVILSSIFYHVAEGWSWIDSVYFTVLLVTTIGHHDLVPTTATSKVFTSIIAFVGIALVLTLFGIISSHYVKTVHD